MAFKIKINDPTDPGVEVDAYTVLALVAKPKNGFKQGIHCEFLCYRSKSAYQAGGASLSALALDVKPEIVEIAYPFCFATDKLSQEGWNMEAVVYAFGHQFYPALADAEPVLDEGQVPLMLDIPEQVADQIRAMLQPQQ